MACKQAPKGLEILVDTREQQPFNFAKLEDVATATRQTLKTGDYTTTACSAVCVCERKASPSELAKNCNEDRFLAVLERAARDLKEFHLILCFSLQELLDYPWKSGLPSYVVDGIKFNGRLVLRRLLEWQADYPALRIHFCGNPTAARDLTIALLRSAERRLIDPPPAPALEGTAQ